MTIVPVGRLSRRELLSLGNNTHAAARRDPGAHRPAIVDDPVFITFDDTATATSEADPQIDAALASEHVAS